MMPDTGCVCGRSDRGATPPMSTSAPIPIGNRNLRVRLLSCTSSVARIIVNNPAHTIWWTRELRCPGVHEARPSDVV
jgi:hypothetical protein